MNFVSTRNNAPAATLSQAIAAGLAPDGGLYVPDKLPAARRLQAGDDLAATTAALLAPFFEGDALAPELAAICARLGRIPTREEYLADIGVVNANGDAIYRYMNFDQIADYQQVAATVAA